METLPLLLLLLGVWGAGSDVQMLQWKPQRQMQQQTCCRCQEEHSMAAQQQQQRQLQGRWAKQRCVI
jgi:hypothetical protein